MEGGREPRDDQPLLGPEDGRAPRPRGGGCRCFGATLCCLSGVGIAVGVVLYLAAMCTFSEGSLGDGRPFPSLPTCAAVSPLTAYVGMAERQWHRLNVTIPHLNVTMPHLNVTLPGGVDPVAWVNAMRGNSSTLAAADGEEAEPEGGDDADAEARAQAQEAAAAAAASARRPAAPQQTPARQQPVRPKQVKAKAGQAKTGKVAPVPKPAQGKVAPFPAPGKVAPFPAPGKVAPFPATGKVAPSPATGKVAPFPARGKLPAAGGKAKGPVGKGKSKQVVGPRPLGALSAADAALLAQAVRAGPSAPAPGQRQPKLAFLFLTPGGLPMAPLWARFFAGFEDQFAVYVHADDALAYASQDLPPVFRGREIPAKAAAGSPLGSVDAIRRLVAHALLDRDTTHLLLVSQRCIPVFPFQYVYAYVTQSAQSFVETGDDSKCLCWDRKLLPEVPQPQWLFGSPWFQISRTLGLRLVNDTRVYPAFLRAQLGPGVAEEHYVQTVLGAAQGLAPRSLTFKYYLPGQQSHRLFTAAETRPGLINKIKGLKDCAWKGRQGFPCYLFARSFGGDTLAPLLGLNSVLGY